MAEIIPASNALIDQNYLAAYLGDNESDTTPNLDHRQLHINAVSQMIEDYLRRKVCPSQSVASEKFVGDGEPSVYVKNMRITGTPTLYYYDGSDWQEMNSTNWPREVVGESGLIELMGGYTFVDDQLYKVSYTTGWASADVPGTLKRVCAREVHRAILRATKKEGVSAESYGDTSTTYDLADLSKQSIRELQSYRRAVL
jgi:hypothetical protein